MSQESNNKTKLAAQKEALGLYLDSLLGVSVFEQLDDSDSIDSINNDQLTEEETSNKISEEIPEKASVQESPFKESGENTPSLDPELKSSNLIEKKDEILNSGKKNTESLINEGSLSSKYLSVSNKTETRNSIREEKKDLLKESLLGSNQADSNSSNNQHNRSSEKPHDQNSSISNIRDTVELEDSHDIYRQKLLDRQKQIQQRKQQRQIERKQQSAKISLSAKDEEGKENKQVLVPRSQFLKNQQSKNSNNKQVPGNSDSVISLSEKKSARIAAENNALTEKTDEYVAAQINHQSTHIVCETKVANSSVLNERGISNSREQNKSQQLRSKVSSSEAEQSVKEDSSTSSFSIQSHEPNLQVDKASISAFSAFAEKTNNIKASPEASEFGSPPIESKEELFNGNNVTEKAAAEPQVKVKNNENKPNFSDAPDLNLSLFLPKVPTLAEIEAIEQKEKVLKAEQFILNSNQDINDQVSETSIINTGLEISTLPVSPHTQRAKNLAPNWAEPSFQALFFDVAGLKLAIPLLELNGIVEWGKDYITPMPGHEKWYLGLLQFRGKSVPIIDTLQQVFPPNQVRRLIKKRTQFNNIIMIDDGNWGLACEQVLGIRTIAADAVKWRTEQTQRRWLLGTVKEQMCALLDGKEFASMLKTGKDSLLKSESKKK